MPMPSTNNASPAGAAAPSLNGEVQGLIDVGAYFHHRGWSLGTSSNYSVVLGRDPLNVLITASGRDKSRLGESDFVIVDAEGKPTTANAPKPSAETLLHVAAIRCFGAGSVLHTHSVWGTVLSERFAPDGELRIEGLEMLKGLAGIDTHEAAARIAIFDNTQDIADLARRFEQRAAAGDPTLTYGFLMRGHGLYTWGADLADARRHIECLEFLFEVVGHTCNCARCEL